MIGMSTFGRSFRLANQANHDVGALRGGKPRPGKYTREPGFLAYYEVCSLTLLQINGFCRDDVECEFK